jgi:hypothetical protein
VALGELLCLCSLHSNGSGQLERSRKCVKPKLHAMC